MPADTEPRGRLQWIDAVRGIAILLVVVHHALLFTQSIGLPVSLWPVLDGLLQSFRMPLFFLASGLLVARALGRPWAALARSKFAVWIWLYLLWSLITVAVFSVVPWYRANQPAAGLDRLPDIVTWPLNGLWYLYALSVFLLALRLTTRAPAWSVIGLAAVLAVLFGTGTLSTGNFAFDNMGRYFLFFALGARAPELVHGAARRLSGRTGLLVIGGYVVVTAAIALAARLGGTSILDLNELPLVRPALGLLAAAAGIAVAVLIADRAVGRPLVRLGRQTLPVYVAHEIVLGCLTAALIAIGDGPPRATGVVLPLVLTAVAVALTLLLHRLVGRVPGLYAPPAWLRSPRTGPTSPPAAVTRPSTAAVGPRPAEGQGG